jgi:peroxiredoxin
MKYFFVALVVLCINVAVYAQPKIGSKAPDISLPDANGQIIKLSSLQGKVVLLDFWASWCGPCRRNNSHTLPVYNQYKDKGFEIYGVSIDQNTQAWTNAVKQDKTTWVHVIDTKAGTGNELTQTWNLQYIPSTFLIDKQGTIVAAAPEGKELENWLKKLL